MIEADILDLPELTQICESYIAARVSADNVYDLHKFAQEIAAQQLQHVCEYYCERKGLAMPSILPQSESQPLLT